MIYVLNYFENDIYERCNAGLMNKKTELVFLFLSLSLLDRTRVIYRFLFEQGGLCVGVFAVCGGSSQSWETSKRR